MNVSVAARLLFWAALVFAVTMALSPNPPNLIELSDKWQHMVAFAVLAALASIGYPTTSALRIGVRLSVLGALIELVQSIPVLHRDCDPLDWAADTLAVAVMLVILGAIARSARPAT